MTDDLRPINERTGERKDVSLIDDLADVLAHMVVGWQIPLEDGSTVNLAEHPEVQRVMARYRAYKEENNAILRNLLAGGPS